MSPTPHPDAFEGLREQARAARRDEKELVGLREAIEKADAECTQRARLLADEVRDVDALRGTTLSVLWLLFLGTLAEEREREEREALGARLRLRQAEDELARLRARAAELETGAQRRERVLTELDAARRARSAALQARGGVLASRLCALEERVDVLTGQLEEIAEAEGALARARGELESMRGLLHEACGYGFADALSVGNWANFAMQYGKRQKLNEAHACAIRATEALRCLQAELGDLGPGGSAGLALELDLGGFLSVADWYLDGLVVDALALRRTQRASERVGSVLDTLAILAPRLRGARARAESELARAVRFRDEVLAAGASTHRP